MEEDEKQVVTEPEPTPEETPEVNQKRSSKKKVAIAVIVVVVVACLAGAFGYYNMLKNRAAEIAAYTGGTVAEIKEAASERGFSLELQPIDESLFEGIGNEDMWVVTEVESDVWGKSNVATIAPSPSATTDAFLRAIKTQDQDVIGLTYEEGSYDLTQIAWADSDFSDSETGEIMEGVRQESIYPKMLDFDYAILDEEVDGESATVTVEINAYNIGSAFNNAFNGYISQAVLLVFSGASAEQMQALLFGQIRTEFDGLSTKDFKKEATLTLHKDGNAWIVNAIDRSDDFTNTITGGLRQVVDAISETY